MSFHKALFYLDGPRERKCVIYTSIHQMQCVPVSSVQNLWRPSRVSFFQPRCKYCGQPQILSSWMKHDEISVFTCGSIIQAAKIRKRYLKNKMYLFAQLYPNIILTIFLNMLKPNFHSNLDLKCSCTPNVIITLF